MIISKLEIIGLRGFSTKETVNVAIPNGNVGSGLTILVGPNNSGKSTIIESIHVFTNLTPPSLTEGKRNIINDKKVEINISTPDGKSILFKTASARGSETVIEESGIARNTLKPFIIPSRRMFSPFFSKGFQNRDSQIGRAHV